MSPRLATKDSIVVETSKSGELDHLQKYNFFSMSQFTLIHEKLIETISSVFIQCQLSLARTLSPGIPFHKCAWVRVDNKRNLFEICKAEVKEQVFLWPKSW